MVRRGVRVSLRGIARVGRARVPAAHYRLGTGAVFRDHLASLSMAFQKTITPIDGSVFVERALAEGVEINEALDRAVSAQRAWRAVPVEQRAAICRKFCDA